MIQKPSVIMLGQSHKMMLDGGNKNADKEIYYCSDVDPVIAKLEAESEKFIAKWRNLLFIQWRFANGCGESEDEHTKELFNQWLKQKLEE